MIAWVLVVVPLMAVSLLLMVLALPRLLATAWVVGPAAGRAARGRVRRRRRARRPRPGARRSWPSSSRCSASATCCSGWSGRTATGVWRRTEGRPGRRALAGLLAARAGGRARLGLVAGRRHVPPGARVGGRHGARRGARRRSSTALGEGSQGAATTIWPDDAGPLPTADDARAGHGARAGVGASDGDGGTPATADGADGAAPTWVFPFDRPLPPGEGDNQALAVNTEDGSVAYDVPSPWSGPTTTPSLNRNEAFAAASCRDCRTVAVAFQVVLARRLRRRRRPAEPRRRGQLRLPRVRHLRAGHPARRHRARARSSEADMAELAAIWAELQAFGEQIEGVPLAELQDRLTEFEARILDVVRENTGPETALPDGGSTETGTAGTGPPTRAPRGTAPPTTARPRTGDDRRGPGDVDRRAGTAGRTAATGSAEPTDGVTDGSVGAGVRADGGSPAGSTGRRRHDRNREPVRLNAPELTGTPSGRRHTERAARGAGRMGRLFRAPSGEDGAGRIRQFRRPPGGPVSESSAAGAVRNPDLLGIYCNDHLAAATGGIELVSRMLGRHRGSRYEARLEELLDELREERAALRSSHGRARHPGPPVQAGRPPGWGRSSSRAKLNGHLLSPLAAQRPGRVRVHRHGGPRQAGRLRDAAGGRGGRRRGSTPRCSSG